MFLLSSLLSIFSAANAEIKVVASIKPIHSLASYLMDGVNKPGLIVDGYSSPHGFALKPSHAKMLQEADIIFWVGEDLENFLEKPLDSIANKAEKMVNNDMIDKIYGIFFRFFIIYVYSYCYNITLCNNITFK